MFYKHKKDVSQFSLLFTDIYDNLYYIHTYNVYLLGIPTSSRIVMEEIFLN